MMGQCCALCLLAAVVACAGAQAQSGPEDLSPASSATAAQKHKPVEASPAPPKANIRVDTNLVLVPVNVTDRLNRFVTGLEQTDFHVLEDGVEQKIVSFGNQDAPLSLGIVVDTSGSMGANLASSRRAVAELFKVANPEDEACLIEFSTRPELVVPFTHELGDIQSKLLTIRSKGSTALLDGVSLAMNTMKKAHNPRKAIVVITDGGDNNSRYTFSEVSNRVKEADVQIYAIGIFGNFASPEERYGPGLLSALADPTGGHHFVAGNEQLPDIASKIAIELRNEYLIGYNPANAERDGRYRKITVRIVPPRGLPPLRAYWRTGYYAPTQ